MNHCFLFLMQTLHFGMLTRWTWPEEPHCQWLTLGPQLVVVCYYGRSQALRLVLLPVVMAFNLGGKLQKAAVPWWDSEATPVGVHALAPPYLLSGAAAKLRSVLGPRT